ncbi:MAG: non-ribosomal peptide synthetase [Acidobacteria bacterium]|nr:MAG: non-ribosomal peptide synthetase [Acidobacteriota bacterium]
MNPSAFPASFAQQRLWFLDQLEPGTAAYNLVRVFRVVGPLNLGALTRAFETVLLRHASLRTVFESVDGNPRQVVLPDANVHIAVLDLSGLPSDRAEAEGLQIAREEGKKPLHLGKGPLIRAVLIRTGEETHILVLVMHHIITDGWSISILFRELTQSYADLSNSRVPNLPPLSIQYGEYSEWQRQNMSGEVLANELRHWRKKLEGAQTVLDLPTDYPRPLTHSWRGATEKIVLTRSTLAKMKSIGQAESSTLFMVSLAAFQTLLWRYTRQESILVGTPIAARNDLEIENMIGLFVNTLVFRADFGQRDLTFRDRIRQVRAFALEAYAHQDVPFERLVEALVPQRSLDTHPLFQVMFTFQNIPKQIFEIPGLRITELPFDAGIAKFDLSVDVWEDGEFHCQFEYNTDLFERSTIERMLGHFQQLMESAVESPDAPIAELSIMSAEERRQVVGEWNQTGEDYPRALTIQEAFEQQVERTPQASALIHAGKRWSYEQLNGDANRLGGWLIQQGIGQDCRVGICLERSADTVVALLATLKTGATYVPLDPAFPVERLRFMMEDAALGCVITHASLRDKLPRNTQKILVMDGEGGWRREGSGNLGVSTSSSEVAYVIYTSGSTGHPKGVQGTHRAAINRFAWMWKKYPFQPGEVCCQKTNLGFVDSIWEIFGPLLAGVPSVIIPEEAVRDPELLVQELGREHVTRMVLVPSLLRALLENVPNLQERVPELRLWSCSGEILAVELAAKFRQVLPKARLLNIYGSSEVAADVTCHEVGESDWMACSVAIGRPISNAQIYLLDEHGHPVPAGVRGEIYVGGEGLARGYLNRAELTAERFVANQLAPEQSARLYRTGDVGRYRGNGDLEYVGRVDQQVKLRGQRIELGEIETVLARHGAVGQAVVAVTGTGEQQKLSAYLVMKEGVEVPKAGELRQQLRAKLPEAMVPTSYWQIERMPLLPSGKVNRGELAGAGGVLLGDEQEQVGARNEVEAKLAEIWRELLKVEQVGMEQNFFELGGHSLLVLQLTARIRRSLEVELPVRSVFEAPTIAGLAMEVDKARALGLKPRTPIVQPRLRTPGGISREALMAQLDNLSSSELQGLLQRVLDGKSTA